jgi:hypothetical protein
MADRELAPGRRERNKPPWSVDDPDMKLEQTCYIVRDTDGHALAYMKFQRHS